MVELSGSSSKTDGCRGPIRGSQQRRWDLAKRMSRGCGMSEGWAEVPVFSEWLFCGGGTPGPSDPVTLPAVGPVHRGSGTVENDVPSTLKTQSRRTRLRSATFTSKPLAVGLAALVGLLGTGLVVYAFTQPPSAPRAPSGVAEAEESSRPALQSPPAAVGKRSAVGGKRVGVEDLIVGPVLPAAEPLRVSIPRLHVGSRLVRLGMDDRGSDASTARPGYRWVVPPGPYAG